jgi:predicted amidophosphoribosyltransferase
VIAAVTPTARALIDLLLPRVCAACDELMPSEEDGTVCSRCWVRLPLLPHPRCERCGHPSEGRDCRFCDTLPPFVRAARSVCWVPHPTASGIVRALKYHGWERTAIGIGERMARLSWPDDVRRERTAIIPVPLARVRHRERGFNQAERIAESLAERWQLPFWPDVVRRARATSTQTRLTPGERSANVHGVVGDARSPSRRASHCG